MKKLLFLVGLAILSGPRWCPAGMILDRVSAPIRTLYSAPTPALGKGLSVAYARTFQKSGTYNQAIALTPLYDWGILSMEVLGGSGEIEKLGSSAQGLIGMGGSVHADRVLKAMFPEIAQYIEGPVPFTGGRITYEVQAGAGAGFDFNRKEPAALLYTGIGTKF